MRITKGHVIILAVVLVLTIYQPAVASEITKELLTAGQGQPSEVPVKTAEDQFSPGRILLRMIVGLVATLALLVIIGKVVAGRLGLPTKAAGYLVVVDTLSLGPSKGLMIIKAGKKYYLLGVGGERLDLLTELSIDDLTVSLVDSPNFTDVLDHAKPIRLSHWQQTADALRRQMWQLRRGGLTEHGDYKEEGE
jgi:flagellar biogenesis protein FliO